MPRDAEGNFYTTRLEDDDQERFEERALNAIRFGGYGSRLGSALGPGGSVAGATLGAIGGFILGDQETIFPIDMVAIPAYQAFMIQGTPAFQIYIKEGEVLTQVLPTDAMETSMVMEEGAPESKPKKKRAPSKWNKYTAKKSNQITFKSGKKKGLLNLKKMGVAYRKLNKKAGGK